MLLGYEIIVNVLSAKFEELQNQNKVNLILGEQRVKTLARFFNHGGYTPEALTDLMQTVKELKEIVEMDIYNKSFKFHI